MYQTNEKIMKIFGKRYENKKNYKSNSPIYFINNLPMIVYL